MQQSHFGHKQVAEVTCRSKRVLKDDSGRLFVDSRGSGANIAETAAFMAGEKQILIFSDAGGTGRSYHADLNAMNRRRRSHYLLEAGWRADNAIGNVLKDQRVVITVDGGRTRIRINKKGRRKLKTNRLGFTGEWVEPKLLTIYTVDEHGKKIRASSLPITNDGAYLGYEEFLKILEMYLVSLGVNQAKQVLLVADGESSRRCRFPSRRTGEPEGG